MDTAQNTQDESKVRYVEELEGENDYWLSITDAARICRIQDVSIRRAIAAGRLPVRPTGAGDNKRTRFVRASDLPRANFPILDASAAITSDIRKVDILSIPLQQQKLAEQQEAQAAAFTQLEQRLTEQLAAIQEAQRLQAERYQQDQAVTQERMSQIQAVFTAAMQQQQQEFTATLQQQQEEFNRRLASFDERIVDIGTLALAQAQNYQSLKGELQTFERKMDQVAQSLASQINQISGQQKADLEEIQRLRERMDNHESAQVAALSQLEASIAGIRAMHDGLQLQITELEKEQARDIADLNGRVEKESQRTWLKFTDLASIAENRETTTTATITKIQQQASAQELRLTELFRLLQEEIATRQALSEEVAQRKASSTRAKKAQS
jgi:hypothetical protein